MSPPRVIEILRRCDANGWSLSELARRAEIRRNTLSAIVNGRTRPQRRTLEKIADALGTTPEVLVREDEPRPAEAGAAAKPELLLEYFGELSPALREVVMAFVAGLAVSGSLDGATHAARATEAILRRRSDAASAAAPRRRRKAGA